MERHQPARRGAAARPLRLAPTAGPAAGGLHWLAQGRNHSAGRSPRRLRLGRIMRRTRRGLAVVLALGVLAAMVFGGLLLITPSVTDASSRVRALDRAHGVPYPGPAVPKRFAAALTAAEGLRPGPAAGSSAVTVGGQVLEPLAGLAGGGKTALSRYLAQTLYTPGRSGFMAGAEVDLLVVKLDLSYPARGIVQMYADAAYFGHGWYGLKAASCGYFGTPPQRLSWAQAATLVGVVTSPASQSVAPSPRARALAARVLTRLAATENLPRAQVRQADRSLPHTAHRALACGTRRPPG